MNASPCPSSSWTGEGWLPTAEMTPAFAILDHAGRMLRDRIAAADPVAVVARGELLAALRLGAWSAEDVDTERFALALGRALRSSQGQPSLLDALERGLTHDDAVRRVFRRIVRRATAGLESDAIAPAHLPLLHRLLALDPVLRRQLVLPSLPPTTAASVDDRLRLAIMARCGQADAVLRVLAKGAGDPVVRRGWGPLLAELGRRRPHEVLALLEHHTDRELDGVGEALDACARGGAAAAVLRLLERHWDCMPGARTEVLARCATMAPRRTFTLATRLVGDGRATLAVLSDSLGRCARESHDSAIATWVLLRLVDDPGVVDAFDDDALEAIARFGDGELLLQLVDRLTAPRFARTLRTLLRRRPDAAPAVAAVVLRTCSSADDLRAVRELARALIERSTLDPTQLGERCRAAVGSDRWQRARLNHIMAGLAGTSCRCLRPVDVADEICERLVTRIVDAIAEPARASLPTVAVAAEALRRALGRASLPSVRLLHHLFEHYGALHPRLLDFLVGRSDSLVFPKTGSALHLHRPSPTVVNVVSHTAAAVWRELATGPKPIAVAPILAVQAHDRGCMVFSRYCGPSVGDVLRMWGLAAAARTDGERVLAALERSALDRCLVSGVLHRVARLRGGLAARGVDHGHPHLENFTVELVDAEYLRRQLAAGHTVNTLPYDPARFCFDLRRWDERDGQRPRWGLIVRVIDLDAARHASGGAVAGDGPPRTVPSTSWTMESCCEPGEPGTERPVSS
ncbi:hypothetical protein [Paraliomyxa miuraensis]|uniref:hypothetical protein n=1 Tax=Paraliomyxa miuraensis TaxID=376150 RepID=UPI002252BBE4|nr:hypothetical protein [Paraliomyxa miuraensis]MCX4243594.1 hypothetical protein [Paraliomyxa miuraensis]